LERVCTRPGDGNVRFKEPIMAGYTDVRTAFGIVRVHHDTGRVMLKKRNQKSWRSMSTGNIVAHRHRKTPGKVHRKAKKLRLVK
jgi:hypothetical protein